MSGERTAGRTDTQGDGQRADHSLFQRGAFPWQRRAYSVFRRYIGLEAHRVLTAYRDNKAYLSAV